MEKAITTKALIKEDNEKLKQIYTKVVAPNQIYHKKGFIKCPECGEKILIVPTLRKMNEAIENHVQLHKEKTAPNLLQKHAKAINIRLALAQQILHKI
jgi:DNA-directed RNA polymerase subunit RPC12/RpoP